MHSKYLKQQMKMIWKLPWWFYVEERILRKTKKSGVLAPVHISWDERCNIGWLLRLEHSESNRGNFETNSVANRKPMQIRKDRCDVAEPRFLCNNSSKNIPDTLKASQIWNGCASQERVAKIKSEANYCYSYGFRSLSSKRSTNVTQGTNMEITSLACFRHLLIKGHIWDKINTQILSCLNRIFHPEGLQLASGQWSSPQSIQVWSYWFFQPKVQTSRSLGWIH